MDSKFQFFVGIDWATQDYQVCAVDANAKVVAEKLVRHEGAAIAQFVDWLVRLAGGRPELIGVAIEIPRGTLVESLMERGVAVFAINPKQLDRFRDRYTPAGAKDDRRDAFVLGDSLRTDQHCFRAVRIDDPIIIELRELSRANDELGQEMNRLTNRLTQQLHRFFPQVLRLSSSADEPWLWALLKLVPDPGKVRRLSTRRVDRILAKHRIRRISGSEVVDILKTTPLYVAPGTVQAATAHIDLLLPQLAVVHEQRVACSKRIDALLHSLTTDEENGEHRDVNILRSLPGVGSSIAATMLAEASQPLAERDYHALRTYAGTAPVTKRSGKRITVKMRRGCSHRLRNAVYHWARISAQHDPSSRAIYEKLRKRGHTHGRALRSLADRLIRITVAMLRTRTLYDATRLPKLALSGVLP